MPSPSASSMQPLGANGDHRGRVLFHHVPLAAGSALFVVLFMVAPIFDVTTYGHADILTGPFPRPGAKPASSGGRGDEKWHHSGTAQAARTDPVTADTLSRHDRGRHLRAAGHGSIAHRDGATRPGANGVLIDRRTDLALSRSLQQLTVVTGYLGVGLLAITL